MLSVIIFIIILSVVLLNVDMQNFVVFSMKAPIYYITWFKVNAWTIQGIQSSKP